MKEDSLTASFVTWHEVKYLKMISFSPLCKTTEEVYWAVFANKLGQQSSQRNSEWKWNILNWNISIVLLRT